MGDHDMNAAAEARSGATVAHPLPFNPWYGVMTLLYMTGITLLSSIPRQPGPRHNLVEVGLNVGHIPLFAGLTYLLFRTLAVGAGRRVRPMTCVTASLLLIAFGAFDEWHQSFVPGRSSSLIDLGLDMMGIGAVVLFFRLSALISEES